MAYVVHMLNRAVAVDWLGREVEVPLSYADGMIGAMPVFETREQAEAIASGRYEVREVALIPPTEAADHPTPQEVPDGGR